MKEKRRSLLVADDDSGHRTMLKTLLREWGYDVRLAVDGQEAVDQCLASCPDAVLLDMRMPRKNGQETLVELLRDHPSLPVIIMTAYSDLEAAVNAIKSGAKDYLTKPLDFEKLKITLRNTFEAAELRVENTALRQNLSSALGTAGIVGSSRAMQDVLAMVQTIAPSEATCLVLGESGTGKELIARAIHMGSARTHGPYIAFNCAAISESLIESELFGHEKGAFTGADKRRDGRFILADKGTLFLDEIGEMPLTMQAKILRVLQEREVQPVGGLKPLPVDTRIIAATNRNLEEEVARGNFREDLYYRLNVLSITLPPLRERPEDIPLLASHFLSGLARKNGKSIKGFTRDALALLTGYSWPGNVRELQNVLERAVVLSLGETVSSRELPAHLSSGQERSPITGLTSDPAPAQSSEEAWLLKDIERTAILQTLRVTNGNKSEAAKRLGITRKTLHAKLRKYCLDEGPEDG